MISYLVSVVVPCYNQAQYLSDAIDSVLAQSYKNWECIIVNDGSIDETEKIAQLYAEKDNRIRYLKKENGGLSRARNEGIKMANGELILPLDGDDKIGEDYILMAVNAFSLNQEIKIFYSKAEYFGKKSGEWNLPSFNLKLLAFTNMIFCSAVYRKTEWKKVGGYDAEMKHGLEDWEFWINMLKHEANANAVYRSDYVGFFYRIKDDSMFNKMKTQQFVEARSYVSKKHADFIYKMLGDPISLYRKMIFYKERIERIEKLVPYKVFIKIKNLLFR